MFELYDDDTGELVGELSRDQLTVLVEESDAVTDSDRDFLVDEAVLRRLEDGGADEELVEILWDALGERGEVALRCEPRGE